MSNDDEVFNYRAEFKKGFKKMVLAGLNLGLYGAVIPALFSSPSGHYTLEYDIDVPGYHVEVFARDRFNFEESGRHLRIEATSPDGLVIIIGTTADKMENLQLPDSYHVNFHGDSTVDFSQDAAKLEDGRTLVNLIATTQKSNKL